MIDEDMTVPIHVHVLILILVIVLAHRHLVVAPRIPDLYPPQRNLSNSPVRPLQSALGLLLAHLRLH